MIKDINLFYFYNSRGEPSIKTEILTENGIFSAMCGTGKSRGKWEKKTFNVKNSIENFLKIKKQFLGISEKDWKYFDSLLEKQKNIGAELTTPLSISCLRAATKNQIYNLFEKKSFNFPYPLSNVLGGGAHGGSTSIQEFLIIPSKAKSFPEAVSLVINVWKSVQKEFKKKGFIAGRNDEGAWLTRENELKTLDMLSKITEDFGCDIGLDFAATQFYKHGFYYYPFLGKKFNSEQQFDFVLNLIKTYKLKYVEDPFHENAFSSFSDLRKRVGICISGDDLYCTQPDRIKLGVAKSSTSGIIIKPDQAGTISKTLEAINIAKENNMDIIVSHRSGETCDYFISDFSLAVDAKFIKCGVGGGERIVKLNRLIELWYKLERPKMVKINYL
ncbi:MAG: hypothetical protein QXF15_03125 [Candidatus Aenigmatarchaeota archaeon]|nr:hypothetical protein [Candidatus Aenigmarchaeota archaeon]